MVQTRRQERLRERVRAHMATVTWYTVSHSTRDRNLSSGVLLTGGDGKIFNKNTREPAILGLDCYTRFFLYLYLALRVKTPGREAPAIGSFPSLRLQL